MDIRLTGTTLTQHVTFFSISADTEIRGSTLAQHLNAPAQAFYFLCIQLAAMLSVARGQSAPGFGCA